MGLRAKLLLLFFTCFGLMAFAAITLLFRSLHGSFADIERNNALEQMNQLVRNVESELEHLNQITVDWANWDTMYEFARTGDLAGAESDLGHGAINSAALSMMTVFDRGGRQLVVVAVDGNGQPAADFRAYAPLFTTLPRQFARRGTPHGCGLTRAAQQILMVCWQPIHRADRGGESSGVVVLSRTLDATILGRIRQQSDLSFTVSTLPPGLSLAGSGTTASSRIGPRNVRFLNEPAGVIEALLLDLDASPVAQVQLQFPREVTRQGEEVTWQVIRTLLMVALLNGVALLVGVHVLMVRRLRKLGQGLQAIGASHQWSDRLALPRGQDELAALGRDINVLLGVIEEQVSELEVLSMTDPLTQLANRRAFDSRVNLELRRHARLGTPLCLLSLDVDFFKQYNDHYGHPAGDLVLQSLARTLRSAVHRPADLVIRMGGEEFALLLPDTDTEGACRIAEQIHRQLRIESLPHAYSAAASHVTVSIGIAAARRDTIASLTQRADEAVYTAKRNGRNQTCVAPLPEPASETAPD
ncbi:diguanylate cyclase [Chitinimonas sp. BJYL2]|uniref:GGDEF domain-containing protein n=1 Tax=Chitinimonas sp. BJYL2 TaxID=2976696 RepID=UPI0022B4BAE1|nr:diguanylate cyclase [Chitinimonas sp. BJYL2]